MAANTSNDISLNVNISYSEMSESDQNLVIEAATNAIKSQEKSERPIYHKDIAQMIKQQLDSTKGGTWHVIVGTSFGSFISNETKTLIHFFIGNVAFQVWRHG